MRRPLASPARLRAATTINDATNPAYNRGRDHARRELARELRRLLEEERYRYSAMRRALPAFDDRTDAEHRDWHCWRSAQAATGEAIEILARALRATRAQ